MNPEYPVYIISKGRWESRLTSKALEIMKVPYHIVVEPQEYGQYAAVIDPKKILTLPFSDLGQGSIPARNWVWEHSIEQGAKRHWILDDNIRFFCRRNKNEKVKTSSGVLFKAAEDYIERYTNVGISGFNYDFFVPNHKTRPPITLNTRIYSCILILNSLGFRWRGRYNEDTDLSIRCLKSGLCTILFNCFLAKKVSTMKMKGGNTDELYRQDEEFDGRLEMARHLARQHPDVVKIKWKWGRWQHVVDYRKFQNIRLIRRPDYEPRVGNDEYGMVLKQLAPTKRKKAGKSKSARRRRKA